MDFFCTVPKASFSWPRVVLARLLRRACSWSFWIISFEFVKVCGIRFSLWESFIGFYICCYPIPTILHVVSPTLYIIIVYRVNVNKLSGNFVGAIRTTTTNCMVSFIDFYVVFPTNFRILFLPHTNKKKESSRT